MNNKTKVFREDYYNDNYIDGQEHEYEEETHCVSDSSHSKQKKQPVKKKKKKLIWRILFKLVAIIVALMLIILSVGFVMSLFVPAKTNVLLMATDQDGSRTDTLMVASFDKHTKKITIISIPRDTYIKVSDESYSLMREEYPQPGGKSIKINAVHHYGGEKYGTELVQKEVSNLLGIDIDYYLKVDFEAFRYIIDSVGGIEFYVPRNMIYNDPLQNLHINLKKGLQHLDGQEAEHVMRYRSGYADADIGRINVQQEFIKAFISQTLSKGTILTYPDVYLNALFKYDYVETNFSFFNVVSYAMLVGGIDIENVETFTLPGTPAMRSGQSVYLLDNKGVQNLISGHIK